MAKKIAWFVRLGSLEWSRFTYARPEGDALKLLGSVKRGPQMGALALTQDGHYVQVVGDFITPLNTSQLTRAVALAKTREPERHALPRMAARTTPTTVPVVTVKRRRTYVPN